MSQLINELMQQLIGGQKQSIEAVAHAATVAPSTIRRWITGKSQPDQQTLLLVLNALKASPEQQNQAFTLIDAPRALAHFRAQDQEMAPGLTPELVPCVGDLWRAMRLRRGLLAKQVAAALRIHPSRVTRWEKSLTPPPQDRLEELFNLLQAWPEERAALADRRLVFAPPEKFAAPEEYEHRIVLLADCMDRAESIPGDLCFLVLESELWQLVRQHPSTSELLAMAYSWHSDWLGRYGRVEEENWYDQVVIRMIERSTEQPKGFWLKSLSQSALYLARSSQRHGPSEAVAMLIPWLERVTKLAHKSNLNRDIAKLEAIGGQYGAADFRISLAIQQGEQSDDPVTPKLARYIQAQSLLTRGGQHNAEFALDLIPQDEDLAASQRVRDILLRANALATVGEVDAARDELDRFYHLSNSFGYGHLKVRGFAVEQRL